MSSLMRRIGPAAAAFLIALSGCSDIEDSVVKQDGKVHDLTEDGNGLDTIPPFPPFPDGPTPDAPSIQSGTFGGVCTNLGEKCKTKDKYGYDLYCIPLVGCAPGKGFCTRRCTTAGSECTQSPNGTLAACIVHPGVPGDAGVDLHYCAFICAKAGVSYKCPPGLRCDKPYQGTAVCKPLQ